METEKAALGRGRDWGWRDGANIKQDLWTTVWCLLGGGGIRGTNDHGKYIKNV